MWVWGGEPGGCAKRIIFAIKTQSGIMCPWENQTELISPANLQMEIGNYLKVVSTFNMVDTGFCFYYSEMQRRKPDIYFSQFKVLLAGKNLFSQVLKKACLSQKGVTVACGLVWLELTMEFESNYKPLFMSRQALSGDAGTRQLCGEPACCVWAPACGAVVWTESEGGRPLGSHSEKQLTVLTVVWDPSSLATWLGGETGKSVEENLARSCKWSWSEPDSMLTLLYNPHRLCRISSRLSSSSLCSCCSRTFSLFNVLISRSRWCMLSSFLFRQRCAATRFLLRRRTSCTNSSWSWVSWWFLRSCWKALRLSAEI